MNGEVALHAVIRRITRDWPDLTHCNSIITAAGGEVRDFRADVRDILTLIARLQLTA